MNKEKLQAYNQKVIDEFRSNHGIVGGDFEGAPVMLLTTRGARSGKERVSPLVYTRDGDRYVIIASYAGSPRNPAWYHNLKANPEVRLEVGSETFTARATETSGAERRRLFDAQAALMPVFKEYQQKTEREIPVLVLTRISN